MRLRTARLLAIALVFLAPAAAAARILPPGPEASFGRAEIDLSGSAQVAVAYERTLPGPNLIRVAIRNAGRLDTPTVGRRIGRGALRLVRLGTLPGDRHVVVWRRRGETVVSVFLGTKWVTERLPAVVRGLEVLDAAVLNRRPLLVLGGGSDATVVERRAGKWRAHPMPTTAGPRSALVAAVTEPSGKAVVAWTRGTAAGAQSIEASTFALSTGRWTAPQTAVAAGAVTAPVVGELVVDARGNGALSAVTDPGFAGPSSTPVVAILRHAAAAWALLPPLPASPPQLAFADQGVPVRAWLEGDEVRFSRLAADGLAWESSETALKRPSDDFGSLYAVDDLAVDEDGRVVIAVAVDPGPGPDEHSFLVRDTSGPPFVASRAFASTYGSPRLVVGGSSVAASWVEDASSSGLPEAALAP